MVTDAQHSVNNLTANGNTVTVVLANASIDQTNYKKVTGLNVVVWSDAATTISNLEANMKCSGATPPTNPTTQLTSTTVVTTQSTSVTNTSTSAQATTTQATTSAQITTSTGTTPSGYIPCSSWISFSADDSGALSPANFQTVMNFVSSAIGQINHPERIQYTFGSDASVIWKTATSISQIQSAVNSSIQNTDGTYHLADLLGGLYTAYQSTPQPLPKPPIGALIFVSDTSSPANYADESGFGTRLKNLGFSFTFVLLGPNIDQSKLTNYTTNFITWTDLSQPQPDNWDNAYFNAYACKLFS